jgi:predicted GIY-YIG superfamily endonuclease
MKPGYLYIISNPAYDGFYKIGVTENIKDRLHVYQTADPKRRFKVEYHIFHPDCYVAERKIKEMMRYFCKSQKNEWFECDLQTAIVRLQEQVECEP